MEVIDYGPAAWFLLEHEGHRYADIRCTISITEISLLIRLDETEEAEWHALGKVFVEYFAGKVAYWYQRYLSRDIQGDLRAEADAAIHRWMHETGTKPGGPAGG